MNSASSGEEVVAGVARATAARLVAGDGAAGRQVRTKQTFSNKYQDKKGRPPQAEGTQNGSLLPVGVEGGVFAAGTAACIHAGKTLLLVTDGAAPR